MFPENGTRFRSVSFDKGTEVEQMLKQHNFKAILFNWSNYKYFFTFK